MRNPSSARGLKQIVWKITFSFFLFTFSLHLISCATIGQKPQPKKFKPKAETKQKADVKQAPSAPKEIIRNEPKPLASASSTPQSRAATKLIDQGRQDLADGNFEKAERTFQEAINIDHNNGISYYYLAKAKYELQKYAAASGVLDKAEQLLAGSDEWLDAVNALRQMIQDKIQ